MGLFNISSRLNFAKSSKDSQHHERKRRSYRKHTKLERGLYIDVGEEEHLHIAIDNASRYKIIKETENSICAKVYYDDGTDREILTVRWSSIQSEANTRDHIAMMTARDIVPVPTYRNKEIIRFYNKFVGIGIRNHIKGRTLKSKMNSLNSDEMDAIFMQIQMIVWRLSEITSSNFRHIQNRAFRTHTPYAFLKSLDLVDKLDGNNNINEWNKHDDDGYRCKAVMCHGDLSPEHIIIDGTEVVGLVGWSKGDFMPEVYDRLQYYFRSDPNNDMCWYRKLSDMIASSDSGRPSIRFVINCATYIYNVMHDYADDRRRRELDSLWDDITKNYTLVSCISTAIQPNSDNMSQDLLTSWNT